MKFMEMVAAEVAKLIAKDVEKEMPKPYGDVEYADPEDGKYPIDTEAHVRAAWSYINKPDNYSALGDKAAGVKAKIVAAWKDKIDAKGPPSEAESAKRDSEAIEAAKALLEAPGHKIVVDGVEKKRVSKDVTLRLSELQKGALATTKLAEIQKTDDARRLVYAISNVYSINGALVEDLDGDSFTTRAMEEFIGDVLKKKGTGKFEHEGDACNEVVQGIVLSDELQKALGIDLGLECLVTCTHVPGDAEWATVKDGTWEQSIAGRFWYLEDANA